MPEVKELAKRFEKIISETPMGTRIDCEALARVALEFCEETKEENPLYKVGCNDGYNLCLTEIKNMIYEGIRRWLTGDPK